MLPLLAAVALAIDHKDADLGAVHGWTADGALVYEVLRRDLYAPETYGSAGELEEGTVRHVVVQKGDDIVHDWVVGTELPDFPSAKPSPVNEADWKAWRNANPLTPAVQARTGPAGVRLEVRSEPFADGRQPPVAWKGEIAVVGTHRDDEQEAWVALGLTAGDGFWLVQRRRFGASSWQGALETPVTAWWTKTGAHVAIIVDRPTAMTMRGPEFGELSVRIARAAPLVGVLAPPSLGAAVAKKVASAIEGLGAVQIGEAKAERADTVVYAKEGHEAAAQWIAAKVPGGATVEPMTWDGAQHVVVAVGASAK